MENAELVSEFQFPECQFPKYQIPKCQLPKISTPKMSTFYCIYIGTNISTCTANTIAITIVTKVQTCLCKST